MLVRTGYKVSAIDTVKLVLSTEELETPHIIKNEHGIYTIRFSSLQIGAADLIEAIDIFLNIFLFLTLHIHKILCIFALLSKFSFLIF